MTNSQFEQVYYPRYRGVIQAIARKLARNNADLYDDLVSAGTIGLLGAMPERAGKNEDAFIRNIIRNKMVDVLRWEKRRMFERLDGYLAHNHDVVRDPLTGEPMLVHGENELVVSPMAADDAHHQYTSKAQRLLAIHEYTGARDDDLE